MKLITKEERTAKLIELGVPKGFIDSIGTIAPLRYLVEEPDNAYFYLPKIQAYKIIQDFNIVPIFDEGNSFTVYAFDDRQKKIIHFGLENDQIYRDYGSNFQLLCFDIMVSFFEHAIEDGLTKDQFCSVGDTIGFGHSYQLYDLLNVSVDEWNEKYLEFEKWKDAMAHELKIA